MHPSIQCLYCIQVSIFVLAESGCCTVCVGVWSITFWWQQPSQLEIKSNTRKIQNTVLHVARSASLHSPIPPTHPSIQLSVLPSIWIHLSTHPSILLLVQRPAIYPCSCFCIPRPHTQTVHLTTSVRPVPKLELRWHAGLIQASVGRILFYVFFPKFQNCGNVLYLDIQFSTTRTCVHMYADFSNTLQHPTVLPSRRDKEMWVVTPKGVG